MGGVQKVAGARFSRLLLIAGSFLAVEVSIRADMLDRWHWRNPTPFSETMESVGYGQGKFVAVGDGGLIHTSTDGISWDAGQRPVLSKLNRIIYANGQFIAVGDGGVILTSTNGINWNSQASGTTNDLLAAAYGSGHYVASGRAGQLTISSNAVSWSPAGAGTNDLDWIAFGNGTFVLPVNSPGHLQVKVSSNLQSWTTVSLTNVYAGQHHIWQVEFGNGLFLATASDWTGAGGIYPDSHFYYSSNGTNWTKGAPASTYNNASGSPLDLHWERLNRCLTYGNGSFGEISVPGGVVTKFTSTVDGTSSSNWVLPDDMTDAVAMSYGNSRMVVSGLNGKMWTSTDTVNWQPAYGGVRSEVHRIIADSNKYLIVAAGQPILASSDGLNFSAAGDAPAGMNSVAFDGSNYVAVGGTQIFTSSNSTAWVERTSNSSQWLAAVTRGTSRWVAVGAGGTVVTSPNTLAWTLRSSGTANNLNGVAFGNGIYVAVGYGGTIITSSDGASWDVQFSGTTAGFYRVRFLNGQFFALGTNGSLLVSVDGSTWSSVSVPTSETLLDVAYGNGRYLAGGGSTGIYLTSTNGLDWQDISTKIPTMMTPVCINYLRQSFWIGGASGMLLQSDTADGIPQISGTMLPDGGGFQVKAFLNVPQTYRVQVSTNLAGTFWADKVTNSAPIDVWTDTNILGSAFRMYRVVSP
jgi:hypothetical protein